MSKSIKFVSDMDKPELMEVREEGPWFVDVWSKGQIVIQSDDFHHDAALEVSGDFGGSIEVKRAYAEEICRRLNAINPNYPKRRRK